MEYVYLASTLISALAAALAWTAKILWSKQYAAAKDEIIKAKDEKILLLQREVKGYQEMTPMKIREYFTSVKEQLEEYNDELEGQLASAQFNIGKLQEELNTLRASDGLRDEVIHQMEQQVHEAEQLAGAIEQRQQLISELEEANRRLSNANRMKDEFLATTSHELRTPLTAILGFTSVLKEEIPEDANYREFLDIIEDSGDHLMETLNSLLDLAKLRAGMFEINMEEIDLFHLAFQEVVELQNAAHKKGIQLKVRRPESTLCAMSDVHGLSRIISNLVRNAIKFTDYGSVEVWFEENNSVVELHVSDTGIGIEEQMIPTLFTAFKQGSEGPNRKYSGSGLGLAITSGIVHLLEASIRVESTVGEGSDFIVTLPKVDYLHIGTG